MTIDANPSGTFIGFYDPTQAAMTAGAGATVGVLLGVLGAHGVAEDHVGTSIARGKIGAYVAGSQWTIGSGVAPQYNSAARVITFTLTTVGTAATTGETICVVNFLTFSGSEPIITGTYVAA